MQAGFKKADALIQKNSEKFKKAGRVMTIAGGAIIGVVTGVVKAYADFDKSMTESTAIMGDVSDTMRKKMAEAAKDMSEASTFAAKDLAQAYFYLASAGMDAEQSIAALPAVTKFAQAGAFDLALATDLLTDAQTALGLSSKDVKENQENLIRVGDVLVKANTLANASVQQFSEALTNKAAAALVNVNKEMEEGVAVLAAYADKGVKGNLAGQRLTMMLNGLFDATSKNKKAWDKYGISLFDSSGEMRSIADIIQDLEIRFKDMTTEQKQSTLASLGFNIKTKDSILTLMGSSEKIRQWTKDLKNAGGTTEKVAEKQLKSLTNQLKLAKNTIVNTAISLGEQLAPMVVEIAGKIKTAVGKIRDWIKEHPELTKGIALTAAKAGVLLAVLGPITMMLPGLVAGIGMLGKASIISSVGLGKLGVAAIATYGAYKGLIWIREQWEKSHGKFTEEETKRWAEIVKKFGGWTGFMEKASGGLRKMGGEATIQGKKVQDLNDIWHLYGENTQETLKAIAESKHGEDLKKFLEDTAGKHLEAAKSAEEQGKSLEDLKKDAEGFMKSLEEKLTLPAKLGDEFGDLVEILETELHPALQKLGPNTQQAVLAMMMGTGLLKEDLMNLSAIFPEELEPSALRTFDVLKTAFGDFRGLIRELPREIEQDWKETLMRVAECASVAVGGIDAAFAQAYENQMIRIDNEEKRTLEAIDNKYDATIEKNEALLEAEKEKTKEILKGIDDDYNTKKKYILKNVKDEEKKAAMLADLEKKHELDLEKARTDREQAEQETATALEKIEEAKNEALRIASEDLEEKRAKARRTAAKQEKAVALLSAIVNTAVGVTKALSSTIPPFNIILAAITAAAGAVQVALIKSKPIPLKEGGLVTKRTVAEIGEAGPELIIPLNKLQPALASAGGGFILKQNNYFYGDINGINDIEEISKRLAEKTRRAIEKGRM